MRLLADENFPLPTIEALRQAGHDVTWVRTDLPGTGDAALLDIAEADGRVLLTLDKDFWQLAIQPQTTRTQRRDSVPRPPGNPREHHAVGAAHDCHQPGLERARQRGQPGSRPDGPVTATGSDVNLATTGRPPRETVAPSVTSAPYHLQVFA